MESNTELHQLARCPLSLHKLYLDPIAMTAEASDFCHNHSANRLASLFIRN